MLIFPEIYRDALGLVSLEYPDVAFPQTWELSLEMEDILSIAFWETRKDI